MLEPRRPCCSRLEARRGLPQKGVGGSPLGGRRLLAHQAVQHPSFFPIQHQFLRFGHQRLIKDLRCSALEGTR